MAFRTGMQWILNHPAVLLVGFLVTPLKSLAAFLWDWLKDRLLYQVTVDDSTAAYEDLFVVLNGAIDPQRVRITSERPTPVEEDGGLASHEIYRFYPADGAHWCRIGTDRALLTTTSEKERYGTKRSSTVQIWRGARSRVEAVLEAGRDQRRCPPGFITIHGIQHGDWYQQGVRRVRGLRQLILDPALRQLLETDLNAFEASRGWYRANGVPYHRGLLLEGPPGNGKSSLAQALAVDYRLPLHVVNLASLSSDDTLADLFNDLPARALVLMEDVDTVLRGRESIRNVTFSGLLNVLDGAVASDGRLLVVTSNRPETLDAALLRPGRIDLRLHIPCPGPRERGLLFHQLLGMSGVDDLVEASEGFSMAQVQAVALYLRSLGVTDRYTESQVADAIYYAKREHDQTENPDTSDPDDALQDVAVSG
jgi:mitochondrial chaperone BCS1